MNVPSVSVILPAYNCEKFIGKAIESVLQQTLSDFELIIINDGSTDKTESVIHEFKDPRIVYHKNFENQGLIHSLNTAVSFAKGKYIARMDADDICLQERLATQKKFLDQNEDVSAVATTIEFINEKDEGSGFWELDKHTITPESIRKKMPDENCIAHPTVMMRAVILKEFKYNSYQKNIEDYDLWLRLLSGKRKISKINIVLLQYRTHENSVTQSSNKIAIPAKRVALCKLKFLKHNLFSGKINRFDLKVFFYMLRDFSVFILKSIIGRK